MALRDQPYLPLYIQDFMTDEKLIECSAEATGVYIRLMCILHKSDEYGKIFLKQKDKQTDKPLLNFACKIAKQMPYDLPVVERSIAELLDERVLCIEGDFLFQNRMVKDNALSLVRSEAGKKGGSFAQANIKAKHKANTENENEIENVIVVKEKKERTTLKEKSTKVQGASFEIISYLNELNGTNFRTDTKATCRLIEQRLGEGYTAQELKEIIEYKIAEWKGTEWEKFLQPDTLFNGEKCAKYRNQVQAAKDKGLTAKQIKGTNGGKVKPTMEGILKIIYNEQPV